ncbi:uncharacterized protein DUF3943 [Dysgonomonas alginatilytica]|uniref:Uncharacterized protein DUF3943 n=1 Tax=Dysgonomonas alginatilytica TaxID=1605892 RepID=A0A2V3PWF5_9BACT|nr:DUF3943 domain-containing protein [Dysgonomonas alginatilytica]PXV64485.1 uncharacterized protein DUF3943 [Dysgonomonas alginatilytica]
MKKYILIIALLVPISAYSQHLLQRKTTQPIPADSLDLQYYSKKNGWGAAAQIFTLNMSIWAFDRYIMKEDFAYIGFNSMSDNLKKGFYWDNDQIGTNMFLHPYHGSLYYNSARSRGYNYWESGLFALGGSAMWELFLENEPPSTNDIIATPIGGMALGEVLYRASDLVYDDRKRGGERFRREFFGFLISPTRGLTRIINGDAWKKRSTSGRQFGIPEISAEISAGVRVLELQDEILDKGVGFTTTVSVEYGDRYEDESTKPFDYFTIQANLNIQKSQPVLGQINIIGRLWASQLVDSSKDYLGIGIYQHFDYYDSDTISKKSNEIPYKLAAPAAVGVGLIHKSKRFADWDFNSYVHLNGIILGASLSDHYRVSNRNYNLGSGFGWKTGINISYKDKIGVSWLYEGYRLFTWKGYAEGTDLENVDYEHLNAQGDNSNATFNLTTFRVDLKLRDKIHLTGTATGYRRSTHYKYYNNVYSITAEGRLMLTYKF